MIIDKEFENLLPPLSEEDYKGLEESIKADGCRDPLVVWGDTLVDGHNRYKICTQNGISYQIVKRDFPDREAVILWIITNQMSRRNLTPFQRAELALRLKPVVAEKAKENQREAGGAVKDKLPKAEKTATREELGKIAGVSGKTIDRVETILTKGTKEDIQEVREGKSSISGKAKEIKQREVQPEVKEKSQIDDDLKDYEGAFMANSPDWIRAMEIIQLNCKHGIPPVYKSRHNKIIKAIEELQEFIGGKQDERIRITEK